MKTIGEVIQLSTSYLEQRKVERARRTAEDLLSHVLQAKRMDLYLQFDKPVVESELELLRNLLKRCSQGEPFEYVVGQVEFFHCLIQVDSRVLIPRPETEILVEMLSKKLKKGVVWDVCTGSGCIGIALKKACPELDVTLSDISTDALALAASNARLNEVEVEILQGDLLEPFKGKKADFIICNPPYISSGEFLHLDPSVRNFEPHLALVGGERGVEFYERLERDLPPDANCFFEIGSGQGAQVNEIFGGKGTIHCDWAGHPRFFFLEKVNYL